MRGVISLHIVDESGLHKSASIQLSDEGIKFY